MTDEMVAQDNAHWIKNIRLASYTMVPAPSCTRARSVATQSPAGFNLYNTISVNPKAIDLASNNRRGFM